jgi:hypothetical protein
MIVNIRSSENCFRVVKEPQSTQNYMRRNPDYLF